MNKRLLVSLLVWLCTGTGRMLAQAPQQINYQAVVRNNTGSPVTSGTPVSLRFTIHDLTQNSNPVFTETINDTANQFGLVTTQIGSIVSLAQYDIETIKMALQLTSKTQK